MSHIESEDSVPDEAVEDAIVAKNVLEEAVEDVIAAKDVLNEAVEEVIAAGNVSDEAVAEVIAANDVLNEAVEKVVPAENVSDETVEEMIAAKDVLNEAVEEVVTAENVSDEAVEEMIAAENVSDEAVEEVVAAENVSDEAVEEMIAAENVSDEAAEEVIAAENMLDETVAEVIAAKTECQRYLDWAPDDWSKDEALAMLHYLGPGHHPLLLERFGKRIKFGTAGLRATIGAGTSTMNPLIVLQTCQGVYSYAKDTHTDIDQKGVLIGFDGRHYSREFAQLAAAFFVLAGVSRVFLLQDEIPTPFIPFGLLELETSIGIMITGSHNPKHDNGFKLYWSNGAQIIPPIDANIQSRIVSNLAPWHSSGDLVYDESRCEDPTEMLWEQYFSQITSSPYCYNVAENVSPQLDITYTALHGVGLKAIAAAFNCMGLKPVHQVSEQCVPDPEFPTVADPNPSEADALVLAIQMAESIGSQLILANDPDADKLAVAEMQLTGEWRKFSGNEIAMLLADWIVRNYVARRPNAKRSKAFMVSSVVSSGFMAAMCRAEGFAHFETLPGFKWIGNKIIEKEELGMEFLFAYDIENGFLAGNLSYDKDGVRVAAMFAEMANHLHQRSIACADRLIFLHHRYGYFSMTTSHYICKHRDKADAAFQRLRHIVKHGAFGSENLSVKSVRDVTLGTDSAEPDGRSKLPTLPNDQMITFRLQNGSIVTLRYSGTGPKLKYYVECRGETRSAARQLLRSMSSIAVWELIEKSGIKKRGRAKEELDPLFASS